MYPKIQPQIYNANFIFDRFLRRVVKTIFARFWNQIWQRKYYMRYDSPSKMTLPWCNDGEPVKIVYDRSFVRYTRVYMYNCTKLQLGVQVDRHCLEENVVHNINKQYIKKLKIRHRENLLLSNRNSAAVHN